MVHGILWNYHQDKGQLDLDGFLESSTMQMGQLNGSRHVWLHRASASNQIRTTLKPLLQLCALQLYGLCWCLSYLLITVLVPSSGMTTLYVSSTPSLYTSFTCHVTYVMLTLPFHGISHMFMVAISQRSVYIPCLQLGEPQLELTCNTSSSLTCCSP